MLHDKPRSQLSVTHYREYVSVEYSFTGWRGRHNNARAIDVFRLISRFVIINGILTDDAARGRNFTEKARSPV